MKDHTNLMDEQGFTLIELLISIVVVGILTAVALIGVGGLTNSGSKSACNASASAARAGAAMHFANTNGTYPATFTDMTNTSPVELTLPAPPTGGGLIETDNGWTLTMTASLAGNAPTFVCT